MKCSVVFESESGVQYSVFGDSVENSIAKIVSDNESSILNAGIAFAGPYLGHLGDFVLESVIVTPQNENGVAILLDCTFEPKKAHLCELFTDLSIEFLFGHPKLNEGGKLQILPRCLGFTFRLA